MKRHNLGVLQSLVYHVFVCQHLERQTAHALYDNIQYHGNNEGKYAYVRLIIYIINVTYITLNVWNKPSFNNLLTNLAIMIKVSRS